VGENKTISFVDAPRATLALPVAGGTQEEDPAVLLRGGSGVPDRLTDVTESLARGHRAIRYEQRGTGEIDQPRWALWSCSEAQTSIGRPKKGSLRAIPTPGTRCWRTRDTSRGFKVLVRFVPSYARSSIAEYYRAAERDHPTASLCRPPEPDTFAAPSTRPTSIGMGGLPRRLLLHRRLHRDDSGQGAESCL
jgi:hypothetical protein